MGEGLAWLFKAGGSCALVWVLAGTGYVLWEPQLEAGRRWGWGELAKILPRRLSLLCAPRAPCPDLRASCS